MIRQYLEAALRRARYDKLEDGTFYAEVPRLRGVIATGQTLEECRNQLAEVVEEWVLVRVARGLSLGMGRGVAARCWRMGNISTLEDSSRKCLPFSRRSPSGAGSLRGRCPEANSRWWPSAGGSWQARRS